MCPLWGQLADRVPPPPRALRGRFGPDFRGRGKPTKDKAGRKAPALLLPPCPPTTARSAGSFTGFSQASFLWNGKSAPRPPLFATPNPACPLVPQGLSRDACRKMEGGLPYGRERKQNRHTVWLTPAVPGTRSAGTPTGADGCSTPERVSSKRRSAFYTRLAATRRTPRTPTCTDALSAMMTGHAGLGCAG